MIRAGALFLAAGLLFGCQVRAESGDPRCVALLTTTRVQYVGHAFGRGEITLRRAEHAPGQIEGVMQLYGEKLEEPPLVLAATGTCLDGVARLRLAGAHHPASELRVLGGRFVMVEDPELLGHRFGMWRAEILSKAETEPRELHGYFRERTEDEGAVAKQ